MKKLIYCLLCALAMISCEKEVEDVLSSEERIILRVKCRSDEMASSKALTAEQDKTVKDINIYLFHKTNGSAEHTYSMSGGEVALNIPKGEYDVYVVANYGSDMGKKTKAAIENFEASINDETELENNSVLLMSGKQTVNVVENTSVSITLTRMVAKVTVIVNSSSFPNFKRKSVTLVNAPQSCSAYNPNVSLAGMKYADKNASTLTFYMFENLQGVNNTITTQQQKNKQAAPSQATYIQIIGSYNNYEIVYRIYLGENNTTDFNIRRNKSYYYMIDIKGHDEVDTRVKAIYLTQSAFNASYQIGETATSNISMICPTNNHQYSIAYFLDEGNGEVFLNGLKQTQGVFIPFLNIGETSKNATLTYVQNSVSPVRLRVVYKDEDNFTFSREIATNYVNTPLQITDVSSTESKGGGASPINFTLFKEDYTGTVSYKYEMLSGAGTVKAGPVTVTENVYRAGIIGKQAIQFTPTTVSSARIRLTAKAENGETVSTIITIQVSKTTVWITRTNGSGITFSVSDNKWYNSATGKYRLPSNFGATINLFLAGDNGKQNIVIADHAIKPNDTLELLKTDGTPCDWNGVDNQIIGGLTYVLNLDVTTTATPNKFFDLVINK